MEKQRSLADLYVRGRDVTFDDGANSVTVWVQKMNPIEHQKATRKANAARARLLAAAKDHESEDYLVFLNEFMDFDRDQLIDLLCAVERTTITPVCQAKVADDDEWKNDSYFDGLRDAWFDGLDARFAEDPEDEEAKRVSAELDRFIAAVNEAIDERIAIHRSGLEAMSEHKLRETVIEQRIKAAGDSEWVNEFYRQEILLGTRATHDHRIAIFSGMEKVEELQEPVYKKLHETFRELTVEPLEGKDLAVTPPSSPSSEPSEPAAPVRRSGPRIVEA